MSYSYAGYYQIRDYGINALYPTSIADAGDSTNEVVATERENIMRIAAAVTKAMNRRMGLDQYADYMPFLGQRNFDARAARGGRPDHISEDGLELTLDAPLADLTICTLGDDTSITVDTDVLGVPFNRTPSFALALFNAPGVWTQWATDWRQSIEITGVWCERRQYDTEGWIDSDDAVADAAGLTATVTEITVNAADGADTNNYAPRFDIGQLIRLESEYCIITAVNYSTKKLTVIRGARGTTAATHVITTQIDSFQVEPDIMRACSIATAFEYGRKGKFEAMTVQAGGQSINVLPDLWPALAMELMPTPLRIGSG